MLELYSNERKGKQKEIFWKELFKPKLLTKIHKRKQMQRPLNPDAYLTDELFVRRRPVERLWEYVKIKRLYNIPAEERRRKTKHLELT